MRVLHILPRGCETASVALVRGIWEAGVECVVLAAEGSPAAVCAAVARLPTLCEPPDGSTADLADAVRLLSPDLVHFHAAECHRHAGRLAVLDRWPAIVDVADDELDPDGLPRRGLDIAHRGTATVLLPRHASHDTGRIWPRLPRNVGAIAWAAYLPVAQCAGLYMRLLAARDVEATLAAA